jgi:SAM-dependent methyltransferase
MMDLNRFRTYATYDELFLQGDAYSQAPGLSRRISRWRDEHVARKALILAGEPGLILNVPCNGGRFWPLLAEKSNRIIMAADSSLERLEAACRLQPMSVVRKIRPVLTSLFDLELPENAVDSIFCMHLMHLFDDARLRLALLKEFQRVTRDSVVISLWVDGNLQARRHLKTRGHRATVRDPYHFVTPREVIETEFTQAGFKVDHYIDILPFYATCRVYILRKL